MIGNKLSHKKISKVYGVLYDAYGPQHWWPANSPFEVTVGAILTQNTNWKNVEKAISNLQSNNLLSLQAILSNRSSVIEQCIKPSGYFKQKTKKLKILCKFLKEKYKGNIKNALEGNIDNKRGELLSLWGIGKETADSILLYAGDRPIFVIDAYTKRIVKRMGLGDYKDYDKLRMLFEASLPEKAIIFNEYHALIVEHAKRFCKKHPSCTDCPLETCCDKIF